MTLVDYLRAKGYPEGPATCPTCQTTQATVFVRSGDDLVCFQCFRRGDRPPSLPSPRRSPVGGSLDHSRNLPTPLEQS